MILSSSAASTTDWVGSLILPCITMHKIDKSRAKIWQPKPLSCFVDGHLFKAGIMIEWKMVHVSTNVQKGCMA